MLPGLGLMLALLGPAPIAAQVVELQLREAGTRAPIAGAIVRLLRDAVPVAQGLSSEAGRISLRPPAAGTFRIKVDRIGWTGIVTAPFPVASGELLRREILMASTRLELPGVEVRGRSQCERQGQGGPLAAALWEEIQKALTASLLTERQAAAPLHVREFIREVTPSGRPLREWVVLSAIRTGQVFAALPAATLARSGFVIEERADSVTYAAPDAALLLSDEFVSTHCFQAVPGPDALVGLAFEPIPGRKLPDVRGTLWVDRPTSELKHIEFAYTGLPGMLAKAGLGGRVEFRRFNSGSWIPAYWHVRTPWLLESEVRGTGNIPRKVARLVGYLDRGGRVELATDALGQVDRAILIGRVYDSTAAGGLADAVVWIVGSRDSVVTDGQGNFAIVALASGDQMLSVRHPKLGLLGTATTHPVLLSIGDTIRVEFAVPPLARLVRAFCGNTRNRTGVVGLVTGPDGRPADGMMVLVKWRTPSGGTREERDRTGRDGTFALCDLPADQALPLRVQRGLQAILERPLQLEWGVFQWIEFRLPDGEERR